MAAAKPTLVFVPGSFCAVVHYDSIVSMVTSKGYEVVPVDLLTIGARPGPLPTMYDDAAHIRAEVIKLADQGKDVVLAGHSYGGIPVSESLKGISKQEREREGKKGGVVRVAYMTALAPKVGENLGSLMNKGDDPPTASITVDEEGWMHQNDHTYAAKTVFSDLSLEDGTRCAKTMLSQHSSVSFANEVKYAGYKDLPASYLLCENDKCVSPAVQQECIDNIEGASGMKVDVTKIPSDHVPNLSHPEEMVDWLVSLIEKGGQEG